MPPQTPNPPIPPIAGPDSDMLEPGEQIVTVVHKHPIGIIFIYLEVLVGIIALVGLFIILAPDFLNNLSTQSYRLFLAAVVFAVALLSLILFIATYLYRLSRLLVTDRSLVQITQRGLFSRKVSRLSMSNIEDVNADQNGILATIFNYGTLNVETAGEVENFTFSYTPKPNFYADTIIEARQRYADSLKEEDQ